MALTVALTAGATRPEPAAAKRELTLKQKRARCLKAAKRLRTRSRRRAAARRCRRKYAVKKPAAKKPGATSPGSNASPKPPSPTLPAQPLGRAVSVTAREWSLTPSRPAVAAGQVTIELRNQGEDPHDMVIERNGTEIVRWTQIPPAGYERKTVTVSPGTYTLFCSLTGHRGLGMQSSLRVGS